MRSNPVLKPVINRTHFQIDSLEAPEGLLDFGEILVGPYRRVLLQLFPADGLLRISVEESLLFEWLHFCPAVLGITIFK